MARTSTRGWKGCQLCKPHKNRAFGDPVRMAPRVLRQIAGRTRRVTRHTVTRDD